MAVSKAPNGRWRGIYKRGRQTVATKTFDTKREALAWVEKQKAVNAGVVDARAARRRVVEIVPDFLAMRQGMVAETTWKTETVLLTKWVPTWFGQLAIGAPTARDVERLLRDMLDDGRSYGSMKRFRDALRAFYTWAVRSGYTSDNPVSSAVLPRRTQPIREMRPWSAAELEERFEVWSALHPQAAEVARFLMMTGLRWSEARALEVGDVSLVPYPSVFVQRSQPEGSAVKTTKSGKSRRVPLPYDLVPFVQAQMSGKGSTARLMPPLHQSRFRCQLKWSQTADGRTIHDLRHTAVCLWIATGIDLATVRAWAGHADLSITSRYVHYLGSDADVTALKRLNEGLKTERGTRGVRIGDDEEGEAFLHG